MFTLGAVVATPSLLSQVPATEWGPALQRHARGDWGEICEEDAEANQDALQHGYRLMSVYSAKDGTKFWIITEADRSSTCVLLPEDY